MISYKMTKEFIEAMDNLIDNTIELAEKTNVYYGCITAYLLPQITEEQRDRLEPYITMAILEDPSINIEKMKIDLKKHMDAFQIEYEDE